MATSARRTRRTPIRQVHRPKKNFTPRPLPSVSPKSLRMLSAEAFWPQNPLPAQRYIRTSVGFANEHALFKQMEKSLKNEQNKRNAQLRARRNEAARRIQRAWRHTHPSLTPTNMERMMIMNILYRTKPRFKQAINDVMNWKNLRDFTMPKSLVNDAWSFARYFLH